LTQNSVVLVTLIPTCGNTISAMPITIPIATSASTDQRALGLRSAFQSFRIITPVELWFSKAILMSKYEQRHWSG
ncbi:hypothetical protein V0R37_22965, partial [Pollutimonas sp. H1-120]